MNPMLIIQGANDPRVVKEESDQIVEALRAKGRDVEYLVFEDEGTALRRRPTKNRLCADGRIPEAQSVRGRMKRGVPKVHSDSEVRLFPC